MPTMTPDTPLHAEVLAFWIQAGPGRWYKKDEAFDAELRLRFGALHDAAATGDFKDWLAAPRSGVAYLILTDQIPRNIFRGSAHAFATDGLALAAARTMTEQGHALHIEAPLRQFCYLPFEHSEAPADQAMAVRTFEGWVDEGLDDGPNLLRYARMHADIIARFGRFPHRNAVLGRTSTAEELAFLSSGGFAG